MRKKAAASLNGLGQPERAGLAAAALVIALVWLALGLQIRSEFRSAGNAALRDSANLARTLEAHMAGRLAAIDARLQAAQAIYAHDPAGFSFGPWAGVDATGDIVQAVRISPDGFAVADQNGPLAEPVDLHDGPNIAPHIADPAADRLVIGPPIVGRLARRPVINFSRPLRDQAGGFAGVVTLGIDSASFSRLYHSLDLVEGRITLIGLDGIIRGRAPDPGDIIGTRAADRLLDPFRNGSTQFAERRVSMIDGTERVATMRRVDGYPLIVSVSYAGDMIFAEARRSRLRLLITGIALTALVAGLCGVFIRMRRGERRSRAALEGAFANVGQGIMMIDADGRLAAVNDHAVELLGLPPGLATPGRPLRDIVAWQEKSDEFGGGPAPPPQAARLAGPGGPPVVTVRTRPDGRVLEIRTAYVADGSHVRTYTDITATRRSAQAIGAARDRALAAEAALAAAIENVPHGVLLVGADRRIQIINTAATALLALPPELARPGADYRDIMRLQLDRRELAGVPGLEDRVRAALDSVPQQQLAPFERPTLDGRMIEVRTSILGDGRIVRTFTDVTARHAALRAEAAAREQAEAAEAALEGAFRDAPIGIALIGADRRLQFINDLAVDLLDLPAELARPGVAAQAILQLQLDRGEFDAMPDMAARAQADLAADREGRPTHERPTRDGRIMEVRSQALPDGRLFRTFTDVTARHEAMQAQDRARLAAEAAVRSRTEFLAVVSHELRTPLNAVIGFADLLLAQRPRQDQVTSLETIGEAGHQLLTLVNDILDVARLESGRVTRRQDPFDPPATLRAMAALMAPRAEAKGLGFVLQLDEALPANALGDEERLRQILMKLLDNAVKFTERGGVTLAASALGPDADGWRIAVTVADTGIGIAADAQARLFDPFVQGDSSASRRYGGTGLGLAVCRLLLETMGGSIAVDSSPGAGSRFRLELPLGRPRPAVSTTAVPTTRVLVAEDIASNRAVLMAYLARLGHQADVVMDGAAAVAAVRERPYDVVLMDLMMPEMGGLDAARAIRALPGAAGRIPIIAVTAHASPETEAACLAAGMDRFEAKPLNAERLRAAIDFVTAARPAA